MQEMISNHEEFNPSLLNETVSLANDILTDIIHQINETSEFNLEHSELLNQRLISLTSSITQFIELSTLLSKTLTKKFGKGVPEIKNSHIHLLFVLKGIVQANAKSDYLVLEDLIKHELKDNLTQWKINYLPNLKKSLSL